MKELIDGLFDESKQLKNTVDKVWMLQPSCSFPDNLTHLYPDPEPETPAQPESIEVPTEPETPQVPQAPAEEQGAPLGIIAGAAAGAVVIIAAAAVLIKKKKK